MRRALLVAVAAVFVVAAPAARADGDPASDYLPSRDVLLSFSEGTRLTDSGRQLLDTVRKANAAGYRIKVAVIATPVDLGAVGGIFGEPQRYAEFLGQELSFVYHSRLLIVMPAGLGIYDAGRTLTSEQRLLREIRVRRGVAGLDETAAEAVAKLAAASGRPVGAAASAGGSSWYSSAWFVAVVAGCAAAAIATGFLLGRRWLRRAAESPAPD